MHSAVGEFLLVASNVSAQHMFGSLSCLFLLRCPTRAPHGQTSL